jgi:hypothetical protein
MDTTPPSEDQGHDPQPKATSYRRGLVVSLILGIVASLGMLGLLLWQTYRPLNGMERRFVGTWRSTSSDVVMTFNSDRRQVAGGHVTSRRWWITGNRFYYSENLHDMTGRAVQTLLGNRKVQRFVLISFPDDNHFNIYQPTFGTTETYERLEPKDGSTD